MAPPWPAQAVPAYQMYIGACDQGAHAQRAGIRGAGRAERAHNTIWYCAFPVMSLSLAITPIDAADSESGQTALCVVLTTQDRQGADDATNVHTEVRVHEVRNLLASVSDSRTCSLSYRQHANVAWEQLAAGPMSGDARQGRPIRLAFGGPIAAGKSEAAQSLVRSHNADANRAFDWAYIPEYVNKAAQRLFNSDHAKYGGQYQIMMLTRRIGELDKNFHAGKCIVHDRSFLEDLVFALLNRIDGNMTDAEWGMYLALIEEFGFERFLLTIDEIHVLDVDVETTCSRLPERGNDYEADLVTKHLQYLRRFLICQAVVYTMARTHATSPPIFWHPWGEKREVESPEYRRHVLDTLPSCNRNIPREATVELSDEDGLNLGDLVCLKRVADTSTKSHFRVCREATVAADIHEMEDDSAVAVQAWALCVKHFCPRA